MKQKFKVGDKVEITGYYNTGEVGIIEEISYFEGDLEYWIKVPEFKRQILCHDGEFKKVEDETKI